MSSSPSPRRLLSHLPCGNRAVRSRAQIIISPRRRPLIWRLNFPHRRLFQTLLFLSLDVCGFSRRFTPSSAPPLNQQPFEERPIKCVYSGRGRSICPGAGGVSLRDGRGSGSCVCADGSASEEALSFRRPSKEAEFLSKRSIGSSEGFRMTTVIL